MIDFESVLIALGIFALLSGAVVFEFISRRRKAKKTAEAVDRLRQDRLDDPDSSRRKAALRIEAGRRGDEASLMIESLNPGPSPSDFEKREAGEREPFFVARLRDGNAGYYRVYRDRQALLFLKVGRFIVGLNAETARLGEKGDWMAHSSRLLISGLISAVMMVGLIVFCLFRALAVRPNVNPEIGTFFFWIGVLICGLAVAFLLVLPMTVRGIFKTGAALDRMTIDQLAERATKTDGCFRARFDDLTDVRFNYYGDIGVAGGEVGATIRFRHAPTGKWRFETTTAKDTLDAIEAFRLTVGDENLKIEKALKSAIKAKTASPDDGFD